MKRKLERFRIIEQRENVIERSKDVFESIKGNWRSVFFKNNNPITLELACGRGEYSVNLASVFPEKNFIGVDIKGERIWKGSTLATEQQLKNVGFLRTSILLIENFFEEGEVDEIWITFPDPRPRKRDIKRRLTSERYLELYKKIARPGSYIRLKTDNTALYEFTLETLLARQDVHDLRYTKDLYEDALRPECFDIKTKYEEQFSALGEQIKYLRFHF
jgi:tRNA (guanine-N7-)-methyltransferase